MAKWKNYRDEKMKEKNEQDLLSEHEKEIALANEHTRLTNENAAMDAARDAAFSSQKAEIDAAASIARSKGHSTEGKIVGMQSISPTASCAVITGTFVPFLSGILKILSSCIC